MRINVHAGHNPDGKTACGAIGLIKESTENRAVKDEVISLLRGLGHTVYDCTEDNGKNQSDVLTKIVNKCNAREVDLDVSIHFNDGGGQGTEAYIYDTKGTSKIYAENIVKAISSLGYTNRGVKVNPELYVLRKTVAQAVLVECCFVDSQTDVNKYNYITMAQAIVKGITGQTVTASPPVAQPQAKKSNDVIADEVISGLWGVGQERKDKLAQAGYNYSEVQALVNAKLSDTAQPTVSYYPAYTGDSGSIVTGLNSIGVDSAFNNRKSIAIKNGISNYSGTAQQNIQLLNLLKQGKLVKA